MEQEKFIIVKKEMEDYQHDRIHVCPIDSQQQTKKTIRQFTSESYIRMFPGDIVVLSPDGRCKKLKPDDNTFQATVVGTWPRRGGGKSIFAFSMLQGDFRIELTEHSPYLYTETGHDILATYDSAKTAFCIVTNQTIDDKRRKFIENQMNKKSR